MKAAIILAGGKGTRMKSEEPKVMCQVIFEPMVKYVVDAVQKAGVEDICVITGYKRDVQGVIVMRIDDGNQVVSLERVEKMDEEETGEQA